MTTTLRTASKIYQSGLFLCVETDDGTELDISRAVVDNAEVVLAFLDRPEDPPNLAARFDDLLAEVESLRLAVRDAQEARR